MGKVEFLQNPAVVLKNRLRDKIREIHFGKTIKPDGSRIGFPLTVDKVEGNLAKWCYFHKLLQA